MPKMPADKSTYYLWFDSEFTSLDLDRARLLQVALIITDGRLRRVGPATRDLVLPIRLPRGARLSAWTRQHLGELVARCRGRGALSLAEADARLARAVDRALGRIPKDESRRPVLAGNSVHTDWYLIRKFLPRFAARLHYRHLDVSSLKLEWHGFLRGKEFDKERPEHIRRYFPGAGAAVAEGRHDAYYDAAASIAELGYYRAQLQRRAGPARPTRGAGR
jgi:oligoribonuclease